MLLSHYSLLHNNLRFIVIICQPITQLDFFDRNPEEAWFQADVGCLFLNDSDEQIRSKVRRAVTDSDEEIKKDKKNKPGISNLLLLYSALTGELYKGKEYAEFKDKLAERIIKLFNDLRKHKELNFEKTKKALEEGNKKANKIASAKLKEVKKKIGLL